VERDEVTLIQIFGDTVSASTTTYQNDTKRKIASKGNGYFSLLPKAFSSFSPFAFLEVGMKFRN
jgi:hypothetical protein